MAPVQNLIVIGGSYVGVNTVKHLANKFHGRSFRVLLIEKNSHFQHIFAFPRFAVTTVVDTHKAFIPYVPGTFADCPPGPNQVIRAHVISLTKDAIKLDRKIKLVCSDVEGDLGVETDTIPYAYLVVATGTAAGAGNEKLDGVSHLRRHAQKVQQSQEIVIIGAGAAGVQMATDIKELYPSKSVTLVHSRKNVMSRFHNGLHDIVADRCEELGINMVLGSRVRLPRDGEYPNDGRTFEVELEDGRRIPADLAVLYTGNAPASGVLEGLSPASIDEKGFVNILPTLQIADTALPHVFALGDVANTGAHKAAKPAGRQAEIVAANIAHLVDGEPLEEYRIEGPAAIHMSLGITKNVVFRNPVAEGEKPFVKWRDDGTLDMGIHGVWTRRGGGENFHL